VIRCCLLVVARPGPSSDGYVEHKSLPGCGCCHRSGGRDHHPVWAMASRKLCGFELAPRADHYIFFQLENTFPRSGLCSWTITSAQDTYWVRSDKSKGQDGIKERWHFFIVYVQAAKARGWPWSCPCCCVCTSASAEMVAGSC